MIHISHVPMYTLGHCGISANEHADSVAQAYTKANASDELTSVAANSLPLIVIPPSLHVPSSFLPLDRHLSSLPTSLPPSSAMPVLPRLIHLAFPAPTYIMRDGGIWCSKVKGLVVLGPPKGAGSGE